MTKTGRYLLFTKLLGMLIGLVVAGLTMYIQHDAAEKAASLPVDATRFHVATPKDNASEEEKRQFYTNFIQELIFVKVRDINNTVSKASFAATLINYPGLKYGALFSALLLFVGEFWQFYRAPSSSNSNNCQIGAPIPNSVAQKSGVEISAKTGATSVEVKIVT